MKIDRFPHLSQRLFNRPIAIHPSKAEIVMAALADRFGIAKILHSGVDGVPIVATRPAANMYSAGGSPSVGYDLVEGVALIEISGTLVQTWGELRPYSGMTGYDGIRHNVLSALDAPNVRAIAMMISSYGGEVSGLFDLVDTIHTGRGIKPIWSILNEDAASAAYAIASAADRVTIPRSGIAGSIGVIAMHVDFSRALEAGGVTVTLIHRGARKTDGHPEIPLSEEALGAFQADIDHLGEMFEATVGRNRGIPADAVREMEAATFMGQQAVDAGLADVVLAPDAAFRALLATL